MDNIKVSKIYAKSIYDIASENNKIIETLNLLDGIVKILETEDDLLKYLVNPTVKNESKINVLKEILKDEDEINVNIFSYLVKKNRIDCLIEIKNQYEQIYFEENNELIVTAIFPCEITNSQEERLVKKLEKMKNKKIILNKVVDESIIAGGIVKIKDEIIDGSLRTQLKNLEESF